MATAQQPPPATGPLLRKLKAKLSRRVALALAVALALLMVTALAMPPLAAVLILVLPACALLFLGDYVAHWFKHRPLPPRYDRKGNIQPGPLGVSIATLFILWPYGFHKILDISPLLALALSIPNYVIVSIVIKRLRAPYKRRSISGYFGRQ